VDLEEICWEGLDWIDLAHDRDKWWVPVITAVNVRVS
jgi:hypothetical protein